MSSEFAVKTYVCVGAFLAAAKMSEKKCSESVSVLIGITWPLYVLMFLKDLFKRRQGGAS
jgi:hypothetical protein